jgi:hypothetical protein
MLSPKKRQIPRSGAKPQLHSPACDKMLPGDYSVAFASEEKFVFLVLVLVIGPLYNTGAFAALLRT